MLDGCCERDVTLRLEVAVEQSVATDVDELGAGHGGHKLPGLVDNFAPRDEGAANGIARVRARLISGKI